MNVNITMDNSGDVTVYYADHSIDEIAHAVCDKELVTYTVISDTSASMGFFSHAEFYEGVPYVNGCDLNCNFQDMAVSVVDGYINEETGEEVWEYTTHTISYTEENT